jgi:PAS domain S-box-containing protein
MKSIDPNLGLEAGREYRRLEELWRAFLKIAPVGVAVFDRDMRYLEASTRWQQDYGLEGQQLAGRSHYEVFPDVPERWKEIHRRCLAGAREHCDADPFPRMDGQLEWIRWAIEPWHQDGGEIGGIVIFAERITERIQAEEALRTSEAQYRALIEQAPEAIVIYDLDTQCHLDANRQAERLFGCSRGELFARGVANFYHPVQPDGRPAEETYREHMRLAAEGRSPTFERRILNAKGQELYCTVTLLRLPAANRRVLRASFVDMTERKRAEIALREEEAKFRGLVEQDIAGSVIVDHEGRLAYVNPCFARMAGRSRDELVGRPLLDVVPAEEHATVRESLKRQISGERSYVQLVSKMTTPAGEIRHILVNATRSIHLGRPASIVVVLDVTERWRAEQSLRQSEWKYRTTIELAPVGIVHVAPDGRFLMVNDFFCRLLGYSHDELLGMTPLDVTFPEDLGWSRERLKRARDGAEARGELVKRYRHRDGRPVWCEVRFSVERDPEGHGAYVLAIVNDVTERKQAEEERQRLAAQLQQSQKMEAIGQLTGGMAHDFNNLLGVVLGNLDFLLERNADRPEDRQFVEAAIAAASRGADLTRHMLAFSRRQSLAPTLAELSETLTGAVTLFRRTLGEQIVLDMRIGSNSWPVMIDVAQLESALLNLAVNARDAMPNGGRLTIEAQNVSLDDDAASLNPEALPGDYVVISVSDTGTGMAPEVAARAFDPFFTTKGADGTGLGLSMVHGFVKQSGGHTRLYSEPGRGTRIDIYLPRAGATGKQMREATAPIAARGGSETILVVEDDDALRRIALKRLQALGYRTIAASGPAEALRVIESEAPIDVLFTDLVMPGGMDGRALAKAARERRPDLKILLTSGFSANGFTDTEGESLLIKPYRKDELASRLRAVIESGPG